MGKWSVNPFGVEAQSRVTLMSKQSIGYSSCSCLGRSSDTIYRFQAVDLAARDVAQISELKFQNQ